MNTNLQNQLEPSVKSSADVLVKVDGVSKKFCRSLKRSLWYGVQDVAAELNPFARSRNEKVSSEELREGEFWAVNDVSFELRRGECLGLIGHNGAGKTTLLKMLNGLIKPDRGHIEMLGRVGALIALGAGFNPILTGRENIYVNASILGLTKREIDEKLDEIIDFAEIGEFIDAPVQSYSSGMQVRLGFAVATALKPDVLILDEVLAVGDMAFHARCFKRIGELSKNCAVVFVSHDLSSISRISDIGMLMHRGSVSMIGDCNSVLYKYNNSMRQSLGLERAVETDNSIFSFVVQELSGTSMRLHTHDGLKLCLSFHSKEPHQIGRFLVSFYQNGSQQIGQIDLTPNVQQLNRGENQFLIEVPSLNLASGFYTANCLISARNKRTMLVHAIRMAEFTVEDSPYMGSAYRIPATVIHT